MAKKNKKLSNNDISPFDYFEQGVNAGLNSTNNSLGMNTGNLNIFPSKMNSLSFNTGKHTISFANSQIKSPIDI